MFLNTGIGQQWGYITGNSLTTRIGTTSGVSITPGTSGAYGSYTEILSDTSVTSDCFWVEIIICNNNTSAEARATKFDIGIDTSGGTSYTSFIPDLLASCAGQYYNNNSVGNGGFRYAFPLYIPAGTAIAAMAATEAATARSPRIIVQLYGRPKYPHIVRAGVGVEAIGISGTGGTAVTYGTTNDGAWTSLGATTKNCFYFQHAQSVSNATMSGSCGYTSDLAADNDGTNPKIIQADCVSITASAEIMSMTQTQGWMGVAAGQTIYGRAQCNTTGDSGFTMAAYGVY
jgi:hypothetical protein